MPAATMNPMRLAYSRMPHFYRGGDRLAEFRGSTGHGGTARDEYSPEEWLGSTVTRHGSDSVGVTVLDGHRLDDLVAQRPVDWLGSDSSGAATGGAPVLVKLLDAGERLPVHVHPDAAFAREHLNAGHGKAEAWHIVRTPAGGGQVALGFHREVPADLLREWVLEQRIEPMLEAMATVTVQAGDMIFVPPGVPHVIGGGIFLLEVQEPCDQSILLEWAGFAGVDPVTALMGLDVDAALGAVRRTPVSDAEIERWVTRAVSGRDGAESLLPHDADPFFQLAVLSANHPSSAAVTGFRILVVTTGEGSLGWAHGLTETKSGDAWLVPATVGPIELMGDGLRAVLAAGPANRGTMTSATP